MVPLRPLPQPLHDVVGRILDGEIHGLALFQLQNGACLSIDSSETQEDPFIASRTIAEIRRFVLEKPAGRQRVDREAWFAGPEGPSALFAGRVLPFDEKAALVWARLMSEGNAKGRPRSALDMMIAAVAEANGCIVVTGNEKDFADIEIVNPLRGGI